MKNLTARWLLSAILLATLLVPTGTSAQGYPQVGKPIRMVLPFGAGSGTDVIARILAEDMAKSMGAVIVVDNKPGANGSIAAEYVAKSAPDGYTLLLGTSSAHSANQFLFKQLSYQPIKDFTPIARAINIPFFVVVNSSSGVQTVDQLIAKSRSEPGLSLGYGNSTGQVAGRHLMSSAKSKELEVPYRSTPPALVDLVASRIDYMFIDIASSQALVKEGRLRLIAAMADKPSNLLPALPALGTKYPGFNFLGWAGLMGPAGLPDAITQRLNAEIVKSLSRASVADRLIAQGLEPFPSSPSEFLEFMKEQERVWGQRIKDAGIQPE